VNPKIDVVGCLRAMCHLGFNMRGGRTEDVRCGGINNLVKSMEISGLRNFGGLRVSRIWGEFVDDGNDLQRRFKFPTILSAFIT
jgi:hypothetical protein